MVGLVSSAAEAGALAVKAGYDPLAPAALFRRMQQAQSRAAVEAPVKETSRVMLSALRDYFRTHPPGVERERRLNELVQRNRGELAGKSYYVGTGNYQQKSPKSVAALPGESVKF